MVYYVADYDVPDVPWEKPIRNLVSALEMEGFSRLPVSDIHDEVITPDGGTVLVPIMGPGHAYRLRKFVSAPGRVVPFCWDVWEPDWGTWAAYFGRRLRPRTVFVTAAISARYLDDQLNGVRVLHCPEATDVSWHQNSRPLSSRKIGVLELGRRCDKWHDAVHGDLQRMDICHMYADSADSKTLFESDADLRDGFGNSTLSICFPRSFTHPETAGCVETLTHRYLESIASGCVVLGHAPAELIDLFGYNPVIEVDWMSPARQLMDLLASLDLLDAHVRQASARVRCVGEWRQRARFIRRTLSTST